MKFLRSHWYDIGVIPAAISIVYLIGHWGGISVLQRLAILNFIVIFWHQFEEYRFPAARRPLPIWPPSPSRRQLMTGIR